MMSSHKSTFVLKNSKDSIAKDVGWGEMIIDWSSKSTFMNSRRAGATN
jgi:hypothetical protein